MSRSRRKSPFIGFTTAETDKPWKAQSARRERRIVSAALQSGSNGENLPVKRYAMTNPWNAPKDGKQRLRDPRSPLLRK